MAMEQAAKRACTPNARKRLMQATKDICKKRLSDLSDDEIRTYMQIVGWPKTMSPALDAYAASGNFLVWILNRMLVQLRKLMTIRTSDTNMAQGGEDTSDHGFSSMLESPSIFRAIETKFVAYLVSYTSDINALYAHSHVMVNMAIFNNCAHNTRILKSIQGDADNACLQVIKSADAENALAHYRDSVEAVTDLIRAMYYRAMEPEMTPRLGNRLFAALTLNDIAQKLIDDLNIFTAWNQAFQTMMPTQINKGILMTIVQITTSILEHMAIVAEIIRAQLDDNSNVKNAYNCAAQVLMPHVLLARSEIEDFKTHAKLLFKRSGNMNKDGNVDKVVQRANATMDSMMRILTFTLAPKFIPGLKQMMQAKEYEDLLDMEQLGNMDLDDSAVTYNRRFILNMVQTIHRAETEESSIQHARGLCIMLPGIFETMVDAIALQVQNQSDRAYYGVMIYALVVPLMMRLTRAIMARGSTQFETYRHYALLIEVVCAFHSVLKTANNNHILVHSGAKSDLVNKVNKEAIKFVIDTLILSYENVSKIRKRKGIMENCEDDEDAMRLAIKRALVHQKNTEVATYIQIIPRLWDALLLLISLSLEYADENIQQIMNLLYQDYALNDCDYQEAIYNMLITPQMRLQGLRYSRAQMFAANLVSMYSGANDMTALLDHIRDFVETLGKPGMKLLFLAHPPVIQAFHNSSRESTPSQIPIVIQHFTEGLKRKDAIKYMQYPLMAYIRGIELSSTLVSRVEDVLEELIDLVPLQNTAQGVLMAIQLIITIRKINAWSNADDVNQRWNKHISMIFYYAHQLADNIGTDCSPAIWVALFWFSYHFILVVRDKPSEHLTMRNGVDIILGKMNHIVEANTDYREFMETAITLVVANAHVFNNVAKYNIMVKNVCSAMVAFEMDSSLLDKFKGVIEVLGRDRALINEVLDLQFLKSILQVALKQENTVDVKLKAVSIIKQVLENASGLYHQEGLKELFHTLVEVGRCSITGHVTNTEYNVALLKCVLEVINFVLRREEQFGVKHCCVLIVQNCMEVFATNQEQYKDTGETTMHDIRLLQMLQIVTNVLEHTGKDGLQQSLEIIQEVANVYVFIMTKIMDGEFMKSLNIMMDEQERTAIIAEMVTTIAVKLDPKDTQTADIGNSQIDPEDNHHFVDAVLLVYIIKALPGGNRSLLDTVFESIKDMQKMTDVISEMNHIFSGKEDMDQTRVLYLSSVLYCNAANVHNKDEEALGKISQMHEYVHVLIQLSSEVLERMYEALLEVLYHHVSHTIEEQIQTNAVHALFLTASMQHIICIKRRGLFGFAGEQLDVFKTLCGCQVEKVAHTVETILDNTEPRKLWNNIATQLESIYNHSEMQATPYNWIFRVGAMEVIMLLVDKNNLKSIYGIKGQGKKKILESLEMVLELNKKQLERLAGDIESCKNKENMHWAVLNYLINIAVSIKILIFTRFQVNKVMQELHGTISEHLMGLAMLGVQLLKIFKRDIPNKTIFDQIATSIYIALYNCIRTVEGMSDAQVAKLVRPWIKRIHLVTYIITQFVSLLDEHDANIFAYVARWMAIVSNEQLVDATKWYIPHIVTAVTQVWSRVNKAMATNEAHQVDVIRSNKILKGCVTESIGACEYHAAKTLFLLLSPDMRAFVKENTKIFNRG
ncbi:hypothetical protein BaOVIS_009730 [Babesia ovis]|uniref:Uncharacterized protein n=1 Tax=Babesia ovis TaxID=5869 RepID=A0A9W5T8U4_BABOV|nr:hypothetical protein BaOVIS_009730 [Babesia ovis]